MKKILKFILYVLFIYFCYAGLTILVSFPITLSFASLCGLGLFHNVEDIVFICNFLSIVISLFSPLSAYITAKLFGIFKLIDNLKTNTLIRILILLLISIFNFYILFLKYNVKIDAHNGLPPYRHTIPLCMSISAFGLIPAYFLYKYFNHLTKKHPFPFEQIKYYSSVEFYKKLIKDAWEKRYKN